MQFKITSWNMQGNAVGKLSEVHGRVLSSDMPNIILIQEAGVYEKEGQEVQYKIGSKMYRGFFSEHKNKTNKRCTTGIYIEEEGFRRYAPRLFDLKYGDVARPLIVCSLQMGHETTLYIATIHATANSHVSPKELNIVKEHLDMLKRDLDMEWVLMGDFNIVPENLVDYGIPEERIVRTGKYTHVGSTNAELDYAIVSSGLKGRLTVSLEDGGNSDHFPISMIFDTARVFGVE